MSKTNKKSLFGRFQNLAIAKRITLIYGGIFSFFFASAQWIFLCEYHHFGAEQCAKTAGNYHCQH